MSSFKKISAAVTHCLQVPEIEKAMKRSEFKQTRSGHYRAYITLDGTGINEFLPQLEEELAAGGVQLNPFRKKRIPVLLTLVDDDEAAVSMDAAAHNS